MLKYWSFYFLFFLSPVFLFSQQILNISDDIQLLKFSNHTYIHISVAEIEGFGKVSSNGLLIIDGSEALLMDTPFEEYQTKTLVEWITDSLKVNITTFIPGHWHKDCIAGLGYLHNIGVSSYANQQTIDICNKMQLESPQVGFVDSFLLPFNTIDIECYYLGAAHSLDNIVMWIPSEKILFGGCIVKSLDFQNLGNTADGDREHYPVTVRKIMDKFPDAEIIIPGHGDIGGKELLYHTLKLCGDAE